jgi:anti-sigma B factor antagonist
MSALPIPPFEVVPARATGDLRLALRGELDMYSAPLLERELRNAVVTGDSRGIVLDLAELTFMDVSGLRAILDAARAARRKHRPFVIENPMPHIVRLLELTAIDQTLTVRGRPLSSVA